MRVRTLLIAGVVAFLLLLIARFPAEYLANLVERRLAGVALQGVSGTVIAGRAARLVYGEIDLGPVRWRLRPAALLQGRVEFRIALSSPDNRVRARLGTTFSGTRYGRELVASLQPDRLINHYSPVTIHSSGALEVSLDSFEWIDGFPQAATGRVLWDDAAVLDPVVLVLGEVALDVRSTGEGLTATVVGPGELGLDGTFELAPDGRYRVDLLLQPGDQIDTETLELLEMAARGGPAGNYRIEYAGRL